MWWAPLSHPEDNMTTVNNPQAAGQVDTTGWDLDDLDDTLSNLYFDFLHGTDRELTEVELEALTGPHGLRENDLRPRDWYLMDFDVSLAIVTMTAIVAEALCARDLPGAMLAKAADLPLTARQQMAYDAYVSGLGERP